LITVLDILPAEFLNEFDHFRMQLLSIDAMFHTHVLAPLNKAIKFDRKVLHKLSPAQPTRELPELVIIA